MKNRFFKSVFVLLLTVIISATNALSCFANSAPRRWDGVTSTGAVVTDEECPIIVESELLTFNISDFPPDPTVEASETYVSSDGITAEYHFYNPTDKEITATLVFPFGSLPSYGASNDEKYEITASGTSVAKLLRYTHSQFLEFSIDEDLKFICDEYVEDDFFSPETRVTIYKYKINSSEKENYWFKTVFGCAPSETRYFINGRYGRYITGGKDVEFEISVDTEYDDTFEIIFIGEAPDGNFNWQRSDRSGQGKDKNATVNFLKAETDIITFEEYVFKNYDANSEILRHDWYNSAVSFFLESPVDCELNGRFEQDFTSQLFRWYEYELTFAPGERLTNVVTAPIYPDIDGTYTPFVYSYSYLLSPAKKWADFGTLEVVINTPFYLTDSSVSGFEKTEHGYAASFDGLLENELIFSLSESESPEKNSGSFLFGITQLFLIICSFFFSGSLVAIPFIILLALAVAGIILLIIFIKKKNKKQT